MENFKAKFTETRSAIVAALTTAGIVTDNLLLSANQIPDDLKSGFIAAVVTLAEENGKDPTSKQYTRTDIIFEIFIMVDAANDIDDPDLALYNLKEDFRTAYIASQYKDFSKVEYYTGQADISHPVRIAKMRTEKI
jgi:hypothetical protein